MEFYDKSRCCGAPISEEDETDMHKVSRERQRYYICSECGLMTVATTENRFDAEVLDDQPHYGRGDF